MSDNNQSNAFYMGANSASWNEFQQTEALAEALGLFGIITERSADTLKATIRDHGKNDLKVVFKITVEAVEVVGERLQ